MTTNADKIEALEARIDALEGIQLSLPGESQCSAEFPHVDKLTFVRAPGGNTYRCPCRKVYMKDGKGGLREVVT